MLADASVSDDKTGFPQAVVCYHSDLLTLMKEASCGIWMIKHTCSHGESPEIFYFTVFIDNKVLISISK